MTGENGSNVVVVGIGAMGGGMARALLTSPNVKTVCGYDKSIDAVTKFYEESKQVNKSLSSSPSSLYEAISAKTDFVIISLVNESQCQQVCFGGTNDEPDLLSIMSKGSCVIMTSTVTATWAKMADQQFKSKGIFFLDCPVSGGPARALSGELTMMASGDKECVEKAQPILDVLGSDVHIIEGGAGAGSTVKCVHQLLAGVHICAAAEAMAMGAKAGIDVEQLYRIVNGAAGASWMFSDRGKRMLDVDSVEVKSALDIFVKDLDIVYSEAKAMKSPIPVASAALQQFICGQSMGLGRKDDSQVVKVYETITGVPVAKKIGNAIGDFSKLPDGTTEQIVDIAQEPKHHLLFSNEYSRVFEALIPSKEGTLCHRHSEDSIFIFLTPGGIDVKNYIQGSDSAKLEHMDFGEIRSGAYKSEQRPLIHKLTNACTDLARILDIELLQQPPITAKEEMVAEFHELMKATDKCRIYKLVLNPNERASVTYPFFHCSVVLRSSEIETVISGPGDVRWKRALEIGHVQWKEPTVGVELTNTGNSTFEQYIIEWR